MQTRASSSARFRSARGLYAPRPVAGAIWVANQNAGTVSRIDPATKAPVQTIDVGSAPAGIAVGDGAVWVTNASDGTLSRINADTNRVVHTIPVPQGPRGVAYGEGAVWVANARRPLRLPHRSCN